MKYLRQQVRAMIIMVLLFCLIAVGMKTTVYAESVSVQPESVSSASPAKETTRPDLASAVAEITENKSSKTDTSSSSKDKKSSATEKKTTKDKSKETYGPSPFVGPSPAPAGQGTAPSSGSSSWATTKSKYEGYSDKDYFKQMVKVYYPDTASLDSTSWAWTLAGAFLAFFSIVGLLAWLIAVGIHVYKALAGQIGFYNTIYWKRAGLFLLVILLSFSGGLATIILSWYSLVHQSGGGA